MGRREVFYSLREIFPQIDLRILRAVAIEHFNDIDAAVEFILTDVLSSIMTGSSVGDEPEIEHPSSGGSVSFSHEDSTSNDCAALSHDKSSRVEEVDNNGLGVIYDLQPEVYVEERDIVLPSEVKFMPHDIEHDAFHLESNAALPSEEQFMEHGRKSDTFQSISENPDRARADSSPCDVFGSSHGQLISNALPEEVSLLEHTVSSVLVSKENAKDSMNPSGRESHISFANETVPSFEYDTPNSSLVTLETSDWMQYISVREKETYVSLNEIEELSQQSHRPLVDHVGYELENEIFPAAGASEPEVPSCSREKLPELMDIGSEVQKDTCNSAADNDDKQPEYETVTVSVDNSNIPLAGVTSSGSTISIDLLEEFMSNTQSSKKSLLSAMKTVTDMLQEVELLEKKAKEAREESSTAGQDIVTQVEEMKQILKHIKEANNMCYGEVNAEKAILATETRELQLRLLTLANEKNKSLSTIQEVHRTLEARIADAEKEREVAEKLKHETSESASKSLQELQATLVAIEQESELLKQEEYENAKLRKFLVDRGRDIDVLRGEIAVAGEDVLSLKERVNGHMALRSSISQPTSSLASSSNPVHSTVTVSSGIAPNPSGSLENPTMTDQEDPKLQQVEDSRSPEGETCAGDKLKLCTEDGWELFESCE